jgi:hypothetical protein
MGLMGNVMNWVQPQRDAQTLYVSIDEMPQPRDWGTVQLALGNDVLISRDMALVGSAPDELIGWIERNLAKIKASDFQQIEYQNVSELIQSRIDLLLKA